RPGAASLMSRHSLSACSSSGRTLIRVEIFAEKTRVPPASCSAASWLASSCRAVEQRAYPTRIGLPAGTSAAPESTAGPGDHDLPGARSGGTATFSSSRSAGTRMKRAMWYRAAVLPLPVRQGLPAGASHLGQGWRSAAFWWVSHNRAGGGRLRDQPGETGSEVLVGQGEVPLLVMDPLSAVPASGWWPDTGNRHVRPVTFRPGGGAGRRTGSRC